MTERPQTAPRSLRPSGPRRAFLTFLLAVLGTGASAPAHASFFDTYGYGARGMSLGGAVVAGGWGHSSVYYNPANLLTVKRSHLSLSVYGLFPDLTLERRDDGPPLSATEPGLSVTGLLGASTPFGGVFNNRVAFGAALYHPLSRTTRVESIDPETPNFLRYESLPNKLVLAAAFAFEPIDGFRFGIGVQILANIDGQVDATISIAEQRFTSEVVDLRMGGVIAPTAGISVGPFEGFRAGVSWRSALALDYAMNLNIDVDEIGRLLVDVEGIALYTPDQLTLALAWESAGPTAAGVTVEAGLTWSRWSIAPPSTADFKVILDDTHLHGPEGSGQDTKNLFDVSAAPIPLEAVDTLSVQLGAEWRITEQWAVRGGYRFRPTPLPRPVAESNVLDSNAHIASLGAGYVFVDSSSTGGGPLHIDLAFQVTALENRVVDKAEGFSPEGSWAFGGAIWGLGLELGHTW